MSDQERAGFLLVLEWFENFRARHELGAGRDAAKAFWKQEVLREIARGRIGSSTSGRRRSTGI